jgi:hypothetical protein
MWRFQWTAFQRFHQLISDLLSTLSSHPGSVEQSFSGTTSYPPAGILLLWECSVSPMFCRMIMIIERVQVASQLLE